MKTKVNRIIAFFLIILLICGLFAVYWFWWLPYRELSKGKLAVIGDSGLGPGIYLMNPLLRTWQHLPTDNLFPSHIAWAPDGKSIAFSYYAGKQADAERGIAILDLANMKTDRVYIAPSYNDFVNLVAWTPDGHVLIFDISEPRFLSSLTTIKRLDLQNGELQSITLSSYRTQTNIFPYLGDLENLAIAKNGDYVVAGPESGIFIASSNMENIQHISDGTSFFLKPDEKEITIFNCNQTRLCNYDLDTDVLSQASPENLPFPESKDGYWSYDERDMIYLSGYGGEDDPRYIMLLDTRTNRNYTIYATKPVYLGGMFVGQLAWYSAK